MRRIMLVLGIGAVLISLIGISRVALGMSAQQAEPDALAGHPIVGTWLVLVPFTPDGPPHASPSLYTADGHVVLDWPVTTVGPAGVTYASGWVGTWEPTDERGIHVTAVQVLSDANGAYLGTVTFDGHPMVSEDGQTFTEDDPETTLTVRDAAGAVVTVIGGDNFPPVTATRLAVGSPGFPESTPVAATPAA